MTRVVVVRPTDPSRFSGTVITEWMNVSGGADLAAEWNMAHREMIRNGDAYVAVSAQKVGVEGGGGVLGASLPALKQANAQRYGRLNHPGDAFAYDIFSQVGHLLKDRKAALLGPLHAKRLLATGESQSATFLVTYVNAVDPLARVYDGYLIHSRFGSAAAITGASVRDGGMAPDVKIRADVRVPVLTIITETDLINGLLPGFENARQPDSRHLRTWEMAGTAHADRYAIMVTSVDSGALPIAQLAAAYDETALMGMKLPMRINDGPQQHYIVEAAFRHLDRWIATGEEPPASPRLDLTDGKFRLDANGVATGGIRTPWVDVPISRLSGTNASRSGFLALMGSSEHFDGEKLHQLYPGGQAEYLSKFTASLDAAIAKGFVLAADRQEILDLATARYRRGEGG